MGWVDASTARNAAVASFVAPLVARLLSSSARKKWNAYFHQFDDAGMKRHATTLRWYHKAQTITSIPALVVFIQAAYVPFLVWAENRDDVQLAVLDDPVLNKISPVDLSLPASILIYGALYLFLITETGNPRNLLATMKTSLFGLSLRILFLYATPLKCPEDAPELADIFTEAQTGAHGQSSALTNDLMFSGHTFSLSVMFLHCTSKCLKPAYFIAAVAVACCVIAQHVHYTVDVLVAPFVAFACFRLSIELFHAHDAPGHFK